MFRSPRCRLLFEARSRVPHSLPPPGAGELKQMLHPGLEYRTQLLPLDDEAVFFQTFKVWP